MTSGVAGQAAKDPPTLAAEIAPQVAELHAEGHGRNAIARALAVSPGTVSNAARIAGVQFDRTSTEAATRSRVADLEDDRADLAAMSAAIAKRAGRRLYMEVGAEVLDADAVTALNRVFGTTADKLDRLSATLTDARDEHAAARIWLEGLRLQLSSPDALGRDENGNVRVQIGPPQTTTTPTEED